MLKVVILVLLVALFVFGMLRLVSTLIEIEKSLKRQGEAEQMERAGRLFAEHLNDLEP